MYKRKKNEIKNALLCVIHSAENSLQRMGKTRRIRENPSEDRERLQKTRTYLNHLTTNIKVQIPLSCSHTFLTEILGRSY